VAEKKEFTEDTTPEILYHYTSLDSAISILTKKTLRMTSAETMNDAQELELATGQQGYLIKIIEKIIKDYRKKFGQCPSGYFEDRLVSAWSVLKIACGHSLTRTHTVDTILKKHQHSSETQANIKSQSYHSFIFSLTEDPNNYNQWEQYASNGQGIVLGFNCKLLEKSLDPQFVQIAYEGTEKFYSVLKDFENFLNKKRCEDIFKDEDQVRVLSGFAMGIKEYKWRKEKEWRAGYTLNTMKDSNHLNDIHFKTDADNKLIKPYYEREIDENSIVEIIIGPKSDPRNKHYLEIVAKQLNITPEIYQKA
jgi:hypothetical protein